MLKRTIFIIVDILALCLAFLFFVWLKPASLRIYLPNYIIPFSILIPIWISMSYLFGKYKFSRFLNARRILFSVVVCNGVILSVATTAMYLFQQVYFSRLIVLGTILLATVFEGLMAFISISFNRAGNYREDDIEELITLRTFEKIIEEEPVKSPDKPISELHAGLMRAIINLAGEKVFNFITNYIDIDDNSCSVMATTTAFNVENLPDGRFKDIVNLKQINDIRRINKFFEIVNHKIPVGGHFVCCVETYQTRKKKIFGKYPTFIAFIIYSFDFIFKRIFPKVWGFKTIYFAITEGKNRVISKAETLGRIVSCGFRIVDYRRYNDLLYVVARKEKEPAYDENPTYGPLIKMRRVGKNGKIIRVYKFRTMHPFSEYLQGYIFEKHDLEKGGKFKDDFRINTLGKIMRKLWIDELPMFLNVFKGEMKIVGVRPLSQHYFSLYSKELQEKRIKYKPGLVPPFYADKPETLEEIMASEMKYLEQYEKSPFLTDVRYFFKSFYNIIFKKYRSA